MCCNDSEKLRKRRAFITYFRLAAENLVQFYASVP